MGRAALLFPGAPLLAHHCTVLFVPALAIHTQAEASAAVRLSGVGGFLSPVVE
jgi:hypothetical protein